MEQEEGKQDSSGICCPKRFCYCCCTLKVGLISCQVILVLSSALALVIGHKILRDVILSVCVMAAAIIGLIATVHQTKAMMAMTSLLSVVLCTISAVFSCINLWKLADYLENSWYPILVAGGIMSEEAVEIIIGALIIANSSVAVVVSLILAWNCLSLVIRLRRDPTKSRLWRREFPFN